MDEEIKTRAKSRNLYENLEKIWYLLNVSDSS